MGKSLAQRKKKFHNNIEKSRMAKILNLNMSVVQIGVIVDYGCFQISAVFRNDLISDWRYLKIKIF